MRVVYCSELHYTNFRLLIRNFLMWFSDGYFGISLCDFPMLLSEFHYVTFRWLFRNCIICFSASSDICNGTKVNKSRVTPWIYRNIPTREEKNTQNILCAWMYFVKIPLIFGVVNRKWSNWYSCYLDFVMEIKTYHMESQPGMDRKLWTAVFKGAPWSCLITRK